MASPSDDPIGSPSHLNAPQTLHQRILSQFQGDWVNRLNIDQMFILIDGVLPLEACLYYQVLPLFVEGNRLHLGMVSPEDVSAMEYVRRIVSYLNYSLVPRSISSSALQVVLSAYLSQAGDAQSAVTKQQQTFSYGHHRHIARTKAKQRLDQTERQTLIVDSPEDLAAGTDDRLQAPEPTVPPSPPISLPPPKVSAQPSVDPLSDRAGKPLQPPKITSSTPALTLELTAKYLSSPVEVLATLPPQEMIQELIAKVLVGGIGRLFLERHAQWGRVLWSQNGILQSVLERVPLPTFTELVQGLKQMAQLPPAAIDQPKQVELERLYEGNRVLLRLRFMPGTYGEEVTLQVLRGAALKFYQQQQVDRIGRDALSIARQLQGKLNELRDQVIAGAGTMENKEIIPALSELLHTMETQLDHLDQTSSDDKK